MAKGVKFQITLSDLTMDKLKELCIDKGVKRSSIIAIAIEKYYREEKNS